MYTSFFGLNEKPFAITPDPRYLFMSERHGEGLAHLVYGVTESGGFIQLTGEVGTGKTTLVRTVLGQLPAAVDVALVLNPQLSAREFLLSICEELHVVLPADTGSSKALVDALNRHLLKAHAEGRRTILLVDEAQNLAEDVLEQVRLLTNLETAKRKLLQIILIGQPELRDLLAQNNLRQLAQRVTGRYHLEPLTRDEAYRYIEHRMKVAGALTDVFDAGAKRAVYRASGGVPRLMNVICDRALLGAYSRGTRQVTRRIVRRAAEEVSGTSRVRRMPALLAGSAVVIAVAAGAAVWIAELPVAAPGDAAVVRLPVTSDVAAPLAASDGADVTPQPAAPDPVPAADANTEAGEAAPTLDDVLLENGQVADVEAAMETLFDLWHIDYRRQAGNGCEQAEAAGLRCLFQRGAWNAVRQLNRPAMLTLTDSNGDAHFPVLTAIEGNEIELAFGADRMRFPVSELTELWFGQYLLMWRPPNGDATALRRGSRGTNVRWLRESLANIRGEAVQPGTGAEVFDGDLEQALMEFQRRHRLQVDGLAGQQTQILINSLLTGDDSPRLAVSSR